MSLPGRIARGIGWLFGAGRPRRPLSTRQPTYRGSDDTPLGYEGIDLDAVASVNRRNASLDGLHGSYRPFGAPAGAAQRALDATHIRREPDDADYARRYHQRWNRKSRKERQQP